MTKYDTKQSIGIAQDYLIECRPGDAKLLIPYVEELAFRLGVTRATVYNWAKRYKAFGELVDKLKDVQCQALMHTGISKQSSATMAIFLLKANHGFKDKGDEEAKEPITVNVSFEKAPV